MQGSEGHIKLTWWQVALAVALILLSMISKLSIFGVEIAGGSTIAAIAALLLLWPLIRELTTRGGSTEFLGLKVQINSLEKRTEEDYAVRIEALRADLEELRQRLSAAIQILPTQEQTLQIETEDETPLKKAIEDYRNHQDTSDWRVRAEIDKRLVAGAGRLPVHRLKRIFDQAPTDRETAMAVAVALGLRHPSNDDVEAAKLLVKLLKYPSERVRQRAISSIVRRGSRTDTSQEARDTMIKGIRSRIDDVRSRIKPRSDWDELEALEEAYRDLTLPR